jgi:hypothetical protein
LRLGGVRPYSKGPASPLVVAAGWLHDTIKDTGTTY